MTRKNIATKEALEAWKKQKKDAGATTPAADDDVVLSKQRGTASGALVGKDAVAAFMKGAAALVRDAAVEEVEAAGADRIAIGVTITDESVDRDDDVVVASGGVMTEYDKNNVMLFGHDHQIPAIGNGVGVHRDGTAWKGIAHFAPKDVHPFAHMVGRLFESKIMKAISQGFIPLEWTYEEDRSFWAMKFLRWEMIEFSAVNVGSNRNALAQARGIGIDTRPALDLATSILDGEGLVTMSKSEALEVWQLLKGDGATFDMGRMKSLVERSTSSLVRAERTIARLPKKDATDAAAATSIDWRSVAVMLGASAGSDEFSRCVRASTFGNDESDAIAEATKSTDAELAKLEAGTVKAPGCVVCNAAKSTETTPTPAPTETLPDPPTTNPDPVPAPDAPEKSDKNAPGADNALGMEQLRAIATKALDNSFGQLRSDMCID